MFFSIMPFDKTHMEGMKCSRGPDLALAFMFEKTSISKKELPCRQISLQPLLCSLIDDTCFLGFYAGIVSTSDNST